MDIALVGEPILREPARQVTQNEFIQPELAQFVKALLQTMQKANGIGIAGPQVFDPRAIMIIASRANPRYPNAPDMQPEVMINPKVTAHSAKTCWEWEGCLSVPALRGYIERAEWVEVDYQSVAGLHKSVKYEGFLARIFLHEYDHLIGKTWLDHISDSKHIMANQVWMKQFML